LKRVLEVQPVSTAWRQTATGYPVYPRESAPSFRAETSTPVSIRRAREAERRQVTVLVCGSNVFDSEVYLELDAEDQTRVLRSFQKTCEEAVSQTGGTVVQCDEKGLLVCFGFPLAFEDAAVRAARAGLSLLEGLKALGEGFLSGPESLAFTGRGAGQPWIYNFARGRWAAGAYRRRPGGRPADTGQTGTSGYDCLFVAFAASPS
jgi:hypothetical protein